MKRQSPLVSIVLPNLNYLAFLEERTVSILSQTHSNWECIVIDGHSTDGSWRFFQKTAATDPRFRLYQEPPSGIYDAWNKGIERARGEFDYIATSDDTMQPDFLEKMVAALEACPSAGIAHCCLRLIDEKGKPLTQKAQWTHWKKVQFYGDWIRKYHLRRRPFDAIVHAGFSTVYSSIIQLVIRKTLFERVGLFTDRFGSVSDFEWELRASMKTDTVHVPYYLSDWRVHADQATDNPFHNTSAFFEKLLLMVDAACKRNRDFDVPRNDLKRFYFARYMGKLSDELCADGSLRRLNMLAKGASLSPSLTAGYIMNKLFPGRKTKGDAAAAVTSVLARFPEARLDPVPQLSCADSG